jgi:hypothetical protein
MELLDAIYKLDCNKIDNLLKVGHSTGIYVYGITLLHWAILKGNIQIVKLLLKHGVVVSDNDINVGTMKNNPDLLDLLTRARSYDSIHIANSLVEGRDIWLRGEVDPITHTVFEFCDECVLVKGSLSNGPITVDGAKFYVFKRGPFTDWLQQSNTNPLTREPIDTNTVRYFTYVNWWP